MAQAVGEGTSNTRRMTSAASVIRIARRRLPLLLLLLAGLGTPALAQVGPDPWEDLRIEAVQQGPPLAFRGQSAYAANPVPKRGARASTDARRPARFRPPA